MVIQFQRSRYLRKGFNLTHPVENFTVFGQAFVTKKSVKMFMNLKEELIEVAFNLQVSEKKKINKILN